MIGTAIIGRGIAGSVFHHPLAEASPQFELRAMVGRDGAANVIADADIDLVIVASPNDSHFSLAAAALEAGKHVVIDKPYVLSLEEADALAALAEAANRRLVVFHNRRWDGDFLTVKRIVADRALGTISAVQMHWDRFRPQPKGGWRETAAKGSGILWDLGPHLIDQALQLFGIPETLCADLAAQRSSGGPDDYFEMTLHYGSRRVILGASSIAAAPRARFALHGDLGSFVKFGIDPQEQQLKAGMSVGDPGFGEETPEAFGSLTFADGSIRPVPTFAGRYIDFYGLLANTILSGADDPVALPDARAVLAILLATRESAASGRRVAIAKI